LTLRANCFTVVGNFAQNHNRCDDATTSGIVNSRSMGLPKK
jgi:hypothetical protein